MSSGKTHDYAAQVLGTALIGYGALAMFDGGAIAVGVPWVLSGMGAYLHLWLSPDLDLQRCNARRRWGSLGFIWYPYARMIRHRSALSHAPILGTLTRAWWLLLGAMWLPWVVWLLVGLAIADVLHWVLDGCPR